MLQNHKRSYRIQSIYAGTHPPGCTQHMRTSCNIAQHGVQRNARCCAQTVGTTCCVRLHGPLWCADTHNSNITISLFVAGIPSCFESFQSFQTNYGTTVISFELQDVLFIAFGNRPASSGLHKTKSFQTNYGTTVISFELQDVLFIAFSNRPASSGLHKTKLPVYALQKNKFKLNQTLDSFSVRDIEYFAVHATISLLWQTDTISLEIARIVLLCTDGKRESSVSFNTFLPIVLLTHTTSPSARDNFYRLVNILTTL